VNEEILCYHLLQLQKYGIDTRKYEITELTLAAPTTAQFSLDKPSNDRQDTPFTVHLHRERDREEDLSMAKNRSHEILHVVLGPMNLRLGHIGNMSFLTAKLSTITVGHVHHTPYLADDCSDSGKVSKVIRVVPKMQSTIL
jgi:hypothetical protein